MDGVTILNSCEVIVDFGFGIVPWAIVVLAIGIGLFATGIYTDSSFFGGLGLLMTILSIAFCLLFGDPVYDTYYQVTIDDNVSYNELTEKYDVLKQEGLIYTIKEKNSEFRK